LADLLSVSQVTSATNLFQWTSRPYFLPMASAGQRPVFLDATNTLRALMSSEFDPRAAVFLDPVDKPSVSVTNQTTARVLSSDWSPHRIQLEVEAAEPSLVVLSQAFYHNWRAHVGDKPVRLLRANHAFQALQVPAGRNQVTLSYEDTAFRWGVCLSLVSASVLGVLRFWRPLAIRIRRFGFAEQSQA
jgi:hypothetical protein